MLSDDQVTMPRQSTPDAPSAYPELQAITHRLNTRPGAILKFKMPIEVFAEHLDAVIESRQAVKYKPCSSLFP